MSIMHEANVNLQQSITNEVSRPLYARVSVNKNRVVQYTDPDEYVKALNNIYSLEISMIEM